MIERHFIIHADEGRFRIRPDGDGLDLVAIDIDQSDKIEHDFSEVMMLTKETTVKLAHALLEYCRAPK